MVDITEEWLYNNILAKMHIAVYEYVNGQWVWKYDRYPAYNEYPSHSKKIQYGQYEIAYPSLFICTGKWVKTANYPNPTTVKSACLVVALEDGIDGDFADAILAIGASKDTVNGKVFIFVDAFLCKGTYRKALFFLRPNGVREQIWDYINGNAEPNQRATCCASEGGAKFILYSDFTANDEIVQPPCPCPEE
jgi:hypothetical protein